MAGMNRIPEQSNELPAQYAPATERASSDATEMLLEFLRKHESPCPVCGYNLKALTRPVCPECGQELVLAVGVARLGMGWLFAAVAPGFFSGIAAIFLLVPIVLRLAVGDGRVSWMLNSVDLFGWCSGAFAILLAIRRLRFIALPRSVQMGWALGIWAVHVAALGLFILLGFMYL